MTALINYRGEIACDQCKQGDFYCTCDGGCNCNLCKVCMLTVDGAFWCKPCLLADVARRISELVIGVPTVGDDLAAFCEQVDRLRADRMNAERAALSADLTKELQKLPGCSGVKLTFPVYRSPWTVCPHTRIQHPENSKPVCLDCGDTLMQLERLDGNGWVWVTDVFDLRAKGMAKFAETVGPESMQELQRQAMEDVVKPTPTR